MMGVDYELFWTLNPNSLTPFVKAFELKQKYEDVISWREGLYIRMAIVSCLDKNAKYPKKPMLDNVDFSKRKESPQEELKRKFLERMEILNTRFGKEE